MKLTQETIDYLTDYIGDFVIGCDVDDDDYSEISKGIQFVLKDADLTFVPGDSSQSMLEIKE